MEKTTAVVKIRPEYFAVLSGMLMQDPTLTLSDLVNLALSSFCYDHESAAGEDTIHVETKGIIAQQEAEFV